MNNKDKNLTSDIDGELLDLKVESQKLSEELRLLDDELNTNEIETDQAIATLQEDNSRELLDELLPEGLSEDGND